MEVFGYNIPLWLIIGLLLVYAYVKYFSWHFGKFKTIGVNGPKPVPIMGNLRQMMKKGILQFDKEALAEYGKVVGIFQGRMPVMLIGDPDMLKQILVKEFESFQNHFSLDTNEPPMDLGLNLLKDEQWRRVRLLLTPTFSGAKLRMMTKHINRVTSLLVKNLEEKATSGESFEFKEYCGAFTMDIIASTAFGLQINSQVEKDNAFVIMAKKAFDISLKNPKMIIFFFFPFLMKPLQRLINFQFFPKDVGDFFVSVAKQTIEEREKSETKQPDFLQLMLDAHKESPDVEDLDEAQKEFLRENWSTGGQRKGLTRDEMYGQAITFLLAGYETTAATLSFFAYNMATNPECQETLHKYIEEAMEGQTDVSYDIAKKIHYLDWCLSESLRIFPPAPRNDRMCGKDSTINGVFIPKDILIAIPIYCLHHDPVHWPEPDKFIPERFSPEETEARHPYVYMPFGLGPRSCVGMRLALLEIKVAIIHLMRNFKFLTCEETQIASVLRLFVKFGAFVFSLVPGCALVVSSTTSLPVDIYSGLH